MSEKNLWLSVMNIMLGPRQLILKVSLADMRRILLNWLYAFYKQRQGTIELSRFEKHNE